RRHRRGAEERRRRTRVGPAAGRAAGQGRTVQHTGAVAMGLLEGQRAFITGGASGIGRATARMIAAEGARVAVADINGNGAKEVAAEIGGLAFEVDVTDPEMVQAAVRDAADAFGGLTIAFNNAGAGLLA